MSRNDMFQKPKHVRWTKYRWFSNPAGNLAFRKSKTFNYLKTPETQQCTLRKSQDPQTAKYIIALPKYKMLKANVVALRFHLSPKSRSANRSQDLRTNNVTHVPSTNRRFWKANIAAAFPVTRSRGQRSTLYKRKAPESNNVPQVPPGSRKETFYPECL